MKRLFITGGNGDIGSAICSIFKNNGYEIISPNSKELNLGNIESIDKYFLSIDLEFDCFIHSAGINTPMLIEKQNIENVYKTITVNTLSFYQILQKLIPCLKKNNGTVVAISSLYGEIGRSGRSAYVMSKHALNGLVKTAAIELGQYGIKVNSISPGFVNTSMTRKNNSLEKIQSFKEQIPIGDLANPEDIANTVYFLCSDKNTYITGQNLIIDGGFISGGFQK